MEINYQALGSGAGIKQFQQGLVNFGASDAAMTDEEMAAVKTGRGAAADDRRQYRAGIQPARRNGDLKLSREAYAGIFLGKITQWNDPVIAKANPGAKLPDTKITVVSDPTAAARLSSSPRI